MIQPFIRVVTLIPVADICKVSWVGLGQVYAQVGGCVQKGEVRGII